jgi:hypothetical protein
MYFIEVILKLTHALVGPLAATGLVLHAGKLGEALGQTNPLPAGSDRAAAARRYHAA